MFKNLRNSETYLLQRHEKWFENTFLKVRKMQWKNGKMKQGCLEVSYINVKEVEQKITPKITIFKRVPDNENGNGLKKNSLLDTRNINGD
jgi:hypothetical protein